MSKIEVPTWMFVVLCSLMVLCGGALILVNYGWDSERTKRVELEQKLSDYEDVGKMSRIQDRPLLKKILEGNYIDSVGIGQSRTWMRPRGTDSIIEVTE